MDVKNKSGGGFWGNIPFDETDYEPCRQNYARVYASFLCFISVWDHKVANYLRRRGKVQPGLKASRVDTLVDALVDADASSSQSCVRN